MKKKITAIILVMAMAISLFTIPTYANTVVTKSSEQTMYTVLDKVVNALVGGIAAMIKTPRSWVNKSDFKSENFYTGNSEDEFLDEPAENAAWYLGYSNASLLTGKELEGEYYVGGSLSVTKKLATKQYDDQKVRTIAISDGRGISIFAVLDAYGIANSDVRAIREIFAKWAKEQGKEITSINISALHQHSCVDTFGMNGDIVSALFLSSVRSFLGKDLPSGQNNDYMNNLYNVTVESMKTAVNNMEKGNLYYGTVDVSKYIHDKRDPIVFDGNLNRLRFVPDSNNSKETWIVNGGIHCVGNGAGGTELTGDYPYYMEKYINENNNANFLYIQGAELAITSDYNDTVADEAMTEKYGERYASMAAYGTVLAKKLQEIKPDSEKKLDPIFNIAFKEVWVEIDNNILVLAAKGGLLVNNVAKAGIGKYEILTEVGYAEIGKDLAISIIPGELAPEIAYGGADTASTSWYGTDWKYESFQSAAGDRKLLVFGLTNDQVGYLLTDNNWHSYFTENEEIVSCGRNAGAQITEAYLGLYKEFNK